MRVPKKQLLSALFVCSCLFLAGVIVLGFSMFGCGAMNPQTPAKVNKTITTIIADAGTVAITAEAQYQAGKIAQTDAARYAINDLGNAYEQAKRVYLQMLTAEANYNGAQVAQITNCGPPAANTSTCQLATAAVTNAKATLDNAQASLQTSLDTLVTKTSSVKALQPKN